MQGTVTVSQGIRLSANYQSMNFDVGLTLPMEPGETPKQAMARVHKLCTDFFDSKSKGRLAELSRTVDDVKRSI